jgi:hypothetical protein
MGVAGYGCVGMGMGHAGFLGKWGGEREGKNSGKIFKNILLLPCLCICRGEEAARAVQNSTVQVFFSFFSIFLRKGKQNLGVTQKWVMTVAPLFTMLTEQRLCVVSL